MRTFGVISAVAVFLLGNACAVAQNSGKEITVIIGKKDCQRLVRHRPAPDVAYRPGVDVRGKPVVSADSGGGPALRLPDTFTFSVSRTIAVPGAAEAEMAIGRIEYNINSGRMTFNGQPLNDSLSEELADRCQSQLGHGQ
jgi:hypothetical protein